jgi:hypothetical protein
MKRAIDSIIAEKNFIDFTNEVEVADANFVVLAQDGISLHVSRQILRLHVPYFRHLFSSRMRESTCNECTLQYTSKVLNAVFNFVYYGARVFPLVRYCIDHNVDMESVIQCSDFLQLTNVIECLDSGFYYMTAAELRPYYHILTRNNMQTTIQKLVRDSIAKTLLDDTSYPYDVVMVLAQARYKNLPEPQEHISFIRDWVTVDPDNRGKHTAEMLETVNYNIDVKTHRQAIFSLALRYCDDATVGHYAKRFFIRNTPVHTVYPH